MDVQLTPALEKLVQKKVKTGGYNSAGEVLEEALRLLEERDSVRAAQLKALRLRIDDGLASLDRGEGVEGERFMSKLTSELAVEPRGTSPPCFDQFDSNG